MNSKEHTNPEREVIEQLRLGKAITGKDIRDIFEANGYSRKSTQDIVGKIRTGVIQKQTGMLIDIKPGATTTYRNLLVPPYGSNIVPFRKRG